MEVSRKSVGLPNENQDFADFVEEKFQFELKI